MPDTYRSPWGETGRRPLAPREPKKKPLIKTLLPASMILAVLVFGAAVFYIFFPKEGPKASITFTVPPRVLVGEPFSLGVSFSNSSDVVLRDAKIILNVPDGAAFLGRSPAQRVIEKAVGDMGPGSVGREDFELIVTGGEGALLRATARLQYSTDAARGAQFEASADEDILIGGKSVGLTVNAPQSVFGGQDFDVRISYINNSGREFMGARLELAYPPFFSFERSSVEPDSAARNSWTLGNLAPGASGSIVVHGRVIGPERSFFNFEASLYADFLGNSYKINSQSTGMAISQSPLSLDITLNNSKDYVARAPDNLTYVLSYRNNSSLIMQDVIIRAQFVGEMFDPRTVSTNGVFDSLTNTISWFGANTPQLLNLGPGQSGTVSFKIGTLSSFPIRLISDKNFTLKIFGQIESRTLPPGTVAEKTISVTELETKVGGKAEISARAFWRDAASGILNQGPYPPQANQPTQYTIHWIIRNYSTDLADTAVSAFLQSGARFTGQIKSNIDVLPIINPASGLITWNIGSIPATKGIISDPVEAIFQVELTPSIAQIGQRVTFLSETRMEGIDVFTGQRVTATSPVLTTDLPHDTTITQSNRRVQP